MILKGSQRGGARQLAAHLLKTEENEHVEIHEMRGFLSQNLHSAMNEIHAISKGTRARQPFFSISLNPPATERVPIEVFEAAVERIEQKLGLDDQPRAIIFHEKEGRRHAHVVWSRIDTDGMKAINLPFFKMKLKDVSRNLYMEHGWKVPPGLIDSKERNPLNYSREEWQQARRAGRNIKDLKRTFQDCWALSDSRKAFTQALLTQGFVLARGDRRGFVAVDYQGEPYAVARYVGVKAKDVRERLGNPEDLPSIEQAKSQIASSMTNKLEQYVSEAQAIKDKRSAAFEFKRKSLVEGQRKERQHLEEEHEKRWQAETKARSERLSNGLLGIWHRLTGKYEKEKRRNEVEALLAYQHDRKEKDELIFRHIQQRQQLNLRQRSEVRSHELEIELLRGEIRGYQALETDSAKTLRAEFRKASQKPRGSRLHKKRKDRNRGFEPEI